MQLESTKPLKFTDVVPGSPILITDTRDPSDPWEGLALDVIAEYGPGRNPAIAYMPKGSSDVQMLIGSGRYTVQMTATSAGLAAMAEGLEGIVEGSSRPTTVRALQFTGSMDSARDCILFTAGKAALRFESSHEPPRMLLGGVNPSPLMPGDYIALETAQKGGESVTTVRVIAQNAITDLYELT